MNCRQPDHNLKLLAGAHFTILCPSLVLVRSPRQACNKIRTSRVHCTPITDVNDDFAEFNRIIPIYSDTPLSKLFCAFSSARSAVIRVCDPTSSTASIHTVPISCPSNRYKPFRIDPQLQQRQAGRTMQFAISDLKNPPTHNNYNNCN